MIFISSQCVSAADNIGDAVEQLAREGFACIELSGGKWYPEYRDDLLEKKNIFNLEYLIHNYFPPQKKDFVLNLASLNDDIRCKSIELCLQAVSDAIELGSSTYSVHAGFYFDPGIEELGRTIKPRKLYDTEEAAKVFLESFGIINRHAREMGVKIYLENNVFNQASCRSLDGKLPAMLLLQKDIDEFRTKFKNFNLLLDIGHLKVTARTLGADFKDELATLVRFSDYIHLSDNDGQTDEHKCVVEGSELYGLLGGINLGGKTIVLETRDSIDKIKNTYEAINKLFLREPCNV